MSKKSSAYAAPHDEELERIVLGSILIVPELFYTLAQKLKGKSFYLVRHQHIWSAMQHIADNGMVIERETLKRALDSVHLLQEIGGDLYISDIVNATPSAMYAEQYAAILQQYAISRELLEATEDIKRLAYDEKASAQDKVIAAQLRIDKINNDVDIDQPYVTAGEAVEDFLKHLERTQNGEALVGIPTGFTSLDKVLTGLHKGDLLITAGRPGMGKTSFLLSLLRQIAQQGARVGIFSLEMGREQLIQRLVSMESGENNQILRSGQLQNQNTYGRVLEASARISELPIFIEDTPAITPAMMRNKALRMRHERGLDALFVDYLQLMRQPGYEGNRVGEVSYISRALKELARELRVPLISAAQLSRAVEQRADKRPMLSDLRESGTIENDADVVMFLYRDVVYNEATENPNQADVIIAKHRNGPTDTVPLYFDAATTRFMQGNTSTLDLGSL